MAYFVDIPGITMSDMLGACWIRSAGDTLAFRWVVLRWRLAGFRAP